MISCWSSRCRPSASAHEIPSKIDRFSRPKNSAYTQVSPFLFRWRNRVKNVALVTTSHMFWPNQRRRTTSLLPIRLRNSTLRAVNVTTQVALGAGVSAANPPKGLDATALMRFKVDGSNIVRYLVVSLNFS